MTTDRPATDQNPPAEVTTFRTFCDCPDSGLDHNEVCRDCGTQWIE